MALIQVQAPGLFTTVQDLGREGFGPLGVSPSGAADPVALRIGNRLVGNPAGAAGLEMTLLGGTFHFPDGAVAALTGSDFEAALDENAVASWAAFTIASGQTLRMGPTRSGARCYLCVHGGIVVKPFLGSASTHVLSGLGGFEGRALRKGDVLRIGSASGGIPGKRLSTDLLNLLTPRKNLRVTAGPQADWFPESTWNLFHAGPYRVTEEANRMGLRLEGPPLCAAPGREMITEGVSLGAIQVPKSGQPIILFVEQQTTGGYPKLANVIAADLSSVGQLRPRDVIRFELVDMNEARSLILKQEELLASLH